MGRVANRIAGSKFTLDNIEWHISSNEGKNCLHGGVDGFDKRFYDVTVNDDALTLPLTSPDGDMGSPGELKFNVEFALNGRELTIKEKKQLPKPHPRRFQKKKKQNGKRRVRNEIRCVSPLRAKALQGGIGNESRIRMPKMR